MAVTQDPTADHRAAGDDATGDSKLYRIAYDHGLRTLDDQRDELNGVRGRAGQFMAFVGSATAFLVGAGLRSPDRDWVFYLVAACGTFLIVGALACLVFVLSPRSKFVLTMDPGMLVDEWIDRQVPKRPTEADLLRHLAKRIQGMIDENDTRLTAIRWWYLGTVVLGTVALACWVGLVWARA